MRVFIMGKKPTNHKERIQVIEDYTGLIVTKATGIAGVIVGGIEMLDPNLLAIDENKGLYALGIGLALVGGNKVITVLRNFFGSFEDNQEKKTS
jgi:hypothetical protein